MKRTIIIALTLALAAPVLAQQIQMSDKPTGTIFGQVDFGIQPATSVNTASAKFTEYRDVPNGGVLPFFRLFGDEALRYDIVAENVKQDDSRYRIRLGFPQFRISFDFNQIPHRFGNDAKTLFTPVAPGVLAIEDQIQRHCQTVVEQQFAKSKAGVNFNFLNGVIHDHLTTANTIDLGLIRKRGTMELRLPPGTPYDVRVTYFQENRTGDRAIGTSFGFGDVTESPEPIDYRTREITTSAEFPFSSGLVRGAVSYNDFTNNITSVLFDNPFRITDATDASAYAAPGAGSIGGASVGRLSLAPGNKSVTGSVGTLLKLPVMQSRLTADVSLSRWTQNEAFIPYTTNTAITVPELPASSLDGRMNVVSSLVTFNARPVDRLTIVVRNKTYDLKNNTPRIELPGYARFDAVWEGIERITVPFAFSTNRSDLTASYILGSATLEGGYRYEQWHRDFRETRRTNEGTWRGAVDWKPITWALLRTSYERGNRSFDHYDNEAAGASFVEPEAFNNVPTLRRYDQAARNTDRVSTSLQLTPGGDVLVSLNYLMTYDNYDQSQHGLLYSKWRTLSAEADWSPAERWSLYGFVSREALANLQRDRQSGAVPSVNPADDWTSHLTDDVDSLGLGGTVNVLPDKLDIRVLGRYQRVNGNNQLASPPGGTPDFAVSIPTFDDTKLWNASAELNYKISSAWNVAVGGWRESYWNRDAATTGLTNYMPGSLFLAGNNGDYRGTVFYMRTSYRR